jgi:hypothetical protein
LETSRITEIIDSSWGNAQGEYRLSSSVLFVVAPDGSGRLFDLEDSFYAVEAVGVRMLRRALREDRETTVTSLARRHGVAAGRIGQDYDNFFQDLERRKLVFRGAAPAAPAPHARSAAAEVLLRPLLAVIRHLPLRARTWGLLAAARIFIRIFGWNVTRRAWLEQPAGSTARTPDANAIAEAVRRTAASHFLGVSCKERSLCCWALCRIAGIPAGVVLGISLFPLASHCWCETAAGCLTDFPDRCESFTPVLKYA